MGTPVWKEVLCQGRHYDPKGDEWYEFKPTHIQRAHKNFQKMRQRGVPLPAIWEHQKYIEASAAPATDEQIAEWKRQYARYTFAHVLDSRVNERGNLDMLLDVVDPEDVRQLEKTKFVSPKVYNAGYWDTKGGTYDGTTIAHVAATPTPVQFWQQPFTLSQGETLYLSVAIPTDEISKKGVDNTHRSPKHANSSGNSTAPCPPYTQDSRWSLAEWVLELSATETPSAEPEMADDSKNDGPPKKDNEGGGGGGDGKNADLKAVIDAIKSAFPGAVISDKVSNWGELCIALESQAGAAESEPDLPPEMPPEDNTASGGAPPMLMSTLDKDANRCKAARAAVKPEIDDVLTRIDAAIASKRLAGPKGRAWRRVLTAPGINLSVLKTGEVSGPEFDQISRQLAEVEKAPPGKPADISELSTTSVERPKFGGEMTTERRDKIVGAILGSVDLKTL